MIDTSGPMEEEPSVTGARRLCTRPRTVRRLTNTGTKRASHVAYVKRASTPPPSTSTRRNLKRRSTVKVSSISTHSLMYCLYTSDLGQTEKNATPFFIRTPNFWRISALNVTETFLNIIVSIGCAVVVFHSYKPTGSTITLYWISRYHDRQEGTLIINKNI